MGAWKTILVLLNFAQIGVAAFMLGITAAHLQHIKFDSFKEAISDASNEANCLIGTSLQSTSLCSYTYIGTICTIAVSFILAILTCISCACCGACGGFLDAMLAGLASIWWAIAGAVLTANGVKSTQRGWPQKQWRMALWISAWVLFGTYAFIALFHMFWGLHRAPSSERNAPDVAMGKLAQRSAEGRRATLASQRSAYAQFQSKPQGGFGFGFGQQGGYGHQGGYGQQGGPHSFERPSTVPVINKMERPSSSSWAWNRA